MKPADPTGELPIERPAVIALGSNLGDRLATLQSALDRLGSDPMTVVTGVSRVYETDPVGGPDQPDYLNAVATLVTGRQPSSLLRLCQDVEADLGRVRSVRWGPRTVDLDLVSMQGVQFSGPDLLLPHPRARVRAFVLVPWLDVEPDAELPGHGAVRPLAEAAPDLAGLRRRDDLTLVVP